jgi:hypothetical protein
MAEECKRVSHMGRDYPKEFSPKTIACQAFDAKGDPNGPKVEKSSLGPD